MTSVGRFGAWISTRNWPGEPEQVARMARELETLGLDAVWIGAARGDLALAEQILAATTTLTVATGIVNVWRYDDAEVAASHHRVTAANPGRFLLGIGVGHAPAIPEYQRPIAKLASYLDALDAAPHPVPPDERVVAALQPQALRMAAARTLGTHPYLVPPEHTADARSVLGPGPLLAPEQKVVLSTEPAEARRVAREALSIYLGLPNYRNNLRRYGLTDEDFTGAGSDRFVDTVVAWGTDDAIRARIEDHLAAGADHVAIQLLPLTPSTGFPAAEWARITDLLPR
jgi:probable F420-dependent oxidoreductase